MYIPSHFKEDNIATLHELIEAYPFAVLLSLGKQGLDAKHMPFELQKNEGQLGTLRAHVARNNPVWQNVTNGDDVLVVFQAGDAYISPQWYPSKQETHKQVPTWNYKVVHAHGKITIRDDESYVRGVVARLTRQHEASQLVPWKMGDSPAEFIDTMLKAIVGIEIEITQLDGKFKLSQNKAATDILGAADQLIKQGDDVIGRDMHQIGIVKQTGG